MFVFAVDALVALLRWWWWCVCVCGLMCGIYRGGIKCLFSALNYINNLPSKKPHTPSPPPTRQPKHNAHRLTGLRVRKKDTRNVCYSSRLNGTHVVARCEVIASECDASLFRYSHFVFRSRFLTVCQWGLGCFGMHMLHVVFFLRCLML